MNKRPAVCTPTNVLLQCERTCNLDRRKGGGGGEENSIELLINKISFSNSQTRHGGGGGGLTVPLLPPLPYTEKQGRHYKEKVR